ncbi:MAG: hypothetical protein WBD95_00930, partial [Xanthobacteraceae bacterium]
MRIWGYWATFGWALLAFFVGQFAALAVLVWWRIGELNTLLDVPFDGIAVALFILIANPITIAILMLAVRLARASQAEYLALAVPQTRDLRVGIICIVG